jgi:large-conductance mechanosensitive channel
MEMSWLAPLVMSLHPRSWDKSPALYLLGLWGVMLVMMMAAHFMSMRQIDSPMFELGVLVIIAVIAFLLLRFYVFWDEPMVSLAWIGAVVHPEHPRWPEVILVLATVAYLWWRGVSFLQRDVAFFTIGLDFRKGVLALVATVGLYALLTQRSVMLFVYAFFFFSLLAVALGRVEDKSQHASGRKEQTFGPEWLGILSISSLGVLALVAAFSHFLWNRSAFAFATQAFAPVGALLIRILAPVFRFLLSLLEPFLQWLVRTIQTYWSEDMAGQLIETPEGLEEAFGGNAGDFTPPVWLEYLIYYVIPAVIVLGVIFLLVVWLDRYRQAARRKRALEQQNHADSVEPAGVEGLVQAGLKRLRHFVGLVGQFGLGKRFYAAISIRNIYGNVQRLAEQRGFPRHQAQTPNDYLPTLLSVFPDQEKALRRITAAYNDFEYGHVSTDPAELEQLRSDWQAVQDAARQTKAAPFTLTPGEEPGEETL